MCYNPKYRVSQFIMYVDDTAFSLLSCLLLFFKISFNRASTVDLEPVCTFRAHGGPVLCLAMIANGKMCVSGGTDGTICCWNLPNPNSEVYDAYGW